MITIISIFIVASEISEYSEDASGEGAESELDTSYSADVSQASDVEEAATEKTLQDDQQEYEDPRDSKYLRIYTCMLRAVPRGNGLRKRDITYNPGRNEIHLA